MSNLHIHFFPVFGGLCLPVTECIGGLFCDARALVQIGKPADVDEFLVATMALLTRR